MTLPYRTRRNLQNIGIGAAILLLVAIIVWMVWLLWLERYVVYSRDGAKLDFSLSVENLSGELALPPHDDTPVDIYYNEGDNAVNTSTELVQLKGYYADSTMLLKEFDLTLEQIKLLPPQTPLMLDLKDIAGRFYYSTTVGTHTSGNVNIGAMDELLAYLKSSNLYLIASVPAFRDYQYGLDNVPLGLHHSSGRYLWMDDKNCYWLDPTNQGTLAYLMQIVSELKALGFDEVVFKDFCFPETDNIKFSGDKDAAIAAAAKKLVENCATDSFAVSFASTKASFPLPEGRTRLYLMGQKAAAVNSVAQQTGLAENPIRLVFLADTNDTRFDTFGVLRAVTTAHFDEE